MAVSNLQVVEQNVEAQRRIADELDQLCALKKNTEDRLALLDQIVKSRFVEMFGDPSANTKSWPIAELGDVLVAIGNGKSFVCESFPRTGVAPAILKLSAATWGVYKPEENKALKPDSKYYPECEVRKGDLLFTRKNTFELVGMCAYVTKTPPNLMLPDLIFRLETNDRIDKLYLANLINFDTFRASVRSLASGSAASMPNISKARLLGLKIMLPPLALQREFAAFVAEIDKSKAALRETVATLDQLYRAKLQEYFG